ncbi:MAG: dTDP-4-dehydrorhamnose reductase [Actinomycetia bacterium]|nr:dTDP-4-dehydrorhamnose reductase [Actinomycetes bacterium]
MTAHQPCRAVITGAAGQLGTALAEVFPRAILLDRSAWDVTEPPPERLPEADLLLHAAAWTNVDGAESDADGTRRANVLGTRHAAVLGLPVVAFSSDYVFDGMKREPYIESDATNPQSVYGETKLEAELEVTNGWVVRTSWLFGWESSNFVRTMIRLGSEQDEVAVVDDQVGCPTFVGHLAEAVTTLVERPQGVWHIAAGGECSWAEFARAIFEDAGLGCQVRPISTEELGRPARRPAYSVLRSERPGAPTLPHWRDGLRDCLRRLDRRAV